MVLQIANCNECMRASIYDTSFPFFVLHVVEFGNFAVSRIKSP